MGVALILLEGVGIAGRRGIDPRLGGDGELGWFLCGRGDPGRDIDLAKQIKET